MCDICCMYSGIFESFLVLEYVCICGNFKLVYLFIDLGYLICEVLSGWKRSFFVLVILGWNECKLWVNCRKI